MQLIIHGSKHNRYSINALLGALETRGMLPALPVLLTSTAADLWKAVRQLNEEAVIAFSFFSTQLAETVRLLREVRTLSGQRLTLVAGGAHATGEPAETVALGFDYVVQGEGEATFPALIKAICQHESGHSIAGLYLKGPDGTIRHTGRRPLVRLDEYLPFAPAVRRFGPIEITRGCPFACRFCQASQLAGSGIRHRSVDAVAELVRLLHRRKLNDIRVITPNVFSYGSANGKNVNVEALSELFATVRRIIGDQGRFFAGSFPSEVRPEHVSDTTLLLLKEYTDNDNLVIGAQSGSQRMLDLCHRGHTVEDVLQATELAVRYGYEPYVDFIFGLPGETGEDLEASIGLMRQLTEMGAKVHGHTFMPLPGTAFAAKAPGHLAPHLRKIVNSLVATGKAFGNWQRQEKQAKNLVSPQQKL